MSIYIVYNIASRVWLTYWFNNRIYLVYCVYKYTPLNDIVGSDIFSSIILLDYQQVVQRACFKVDLYEKRKLVEQNFVPTPFFVTTYLNIRFLSGSSHLRRLLAAKAKDNEALVNEEKSKIRHDWHGPVILVLRPDSGKWRKFFGCSYRIWGMAKPCLTGTSYTKNSLRGFLRNSVWICTMALISKCSAQWLFILFKADVYTEYER